LGYKLTLPKYDINNKIFVEPEVCEAGSKLYEFFPELLVFYVMY